MGGIRVLAGDPVGEVLDGIDRLAVMADEQAQVLTDELGVEPIVILTDLDGGVDAGGAGDPLHQFAYPLSGILSAG